MSENHNEEKTNLEFSAVENFLKWYNTTNDTQLEIRECRDRPDIILSNNVGIEVAHIFPNDKCAQVLLRPQPLSASYDDSDFIKEFNRIIEEKYIEIPSYKYNGDIILLLRVSIKNFDQNDFQRIRRKINIPANCPFKIYVSFYNSTTNDWCVVVELL